MRFEKVNWIEFWLENSGLMLGLGFGVCRIQLNIFHRSDDRKVGV